MIYPVTLVAAAALVRASKSESHKHSIRLCHSLDPAHRDRPWLANATVHFATLGQGSSS